MGFILSKGGVLLSELRFKKKTTCRGSGRAKKNPSLQGTKKG
jgi:hypothetical protein